jgi:hypothetical protein
MLISRSILGLLRKKLTLHFFLLNQSRGLDGSNFSTS